MTQIVDLMADVRWSETDIVNRMEAMIRSHFSAVEEGIINRKLAGAARGVYVLSEQENQEIDTFGLVCLQAQLAGRKARADAALLDRVLNHEQEVEPLAEDDEAGHALLAQRQAARPAATEEPQP